MCLLNLILRRPGSMHGMKNMLLNTGGVENCLYAKENSSAGCFVLLNLKVLFSNYTLLQKLDYLVLLLTKIVN